MTPLGTEVVVSHAMLSRFILLVPLTLFASIAAASDLLVESLLAELELPERAALLTRLREKASKEDWRSLRAAALENTTAGEREVLLPVLVARDDDDGAWLIRTLETLEPDERRKLVVPVTPVRRRFRDVLFIRLSQSKAGAWRRPLNVGINLGLNRRILADVVASAIAEGSDIEARIELLEYLIQWQPKKLTAYLETISAVADPVGARARRHLAPPAPDLLTRAVAEPAPVRVSPSLRVPEKQPAVETLPDDASHRESVARVAVSQSEGPGPAVDAVVIPGLAAPSSGVAAELPAPVESESPRGRVPLILYSTAFGALSFGTIGDIAFEDPTAVAASAVIGSVIGGGIPYLLTVDRDVTLADASYVGSQATWAALAGFQGARLLGLDGSDETSRADESTAILAGLGGMIGSALTFERARWTLADAARVNGVGAQMGLAAYGTLALAGAGNSTSERASIASLTGYALGFLPASFWATHIDRGPGDRGLTAYSTGVGAFLGANLALSSRAVESRSRQLGLGALAGQGLGFVAGTALTPHVDDFSAPRFSLLSGLGATAALGLAAVGPASEEPRYDQLGWVLNGGVAVATGLGLAAPHVLDFAADKSALRTLALSLGGIAGASIPLADPEFDGDPVRLAGGAALGASLGVLGASAVAPYVDGSSEALRGGSAMLALGASVGAGAGLTFCGDACASTAVRGAQAGATLALAGAAVWADRFPTGPSELRGGMGVGAWTAWNAGLATQLFSDDFGRREAGITMMAGSAGIATGAFIADRQWLGGRELLRFDALWAVRNAWGFSGARTLELGRRETVATTLAAPLLGIGLDGVVHRAVGGRVPATRYLGGVAFGGATGALLGGRQRGWAASFGALTAATFSPLTVLFLDDGDFGESLLWSSAGYLAGVSAAELLDAELDHGAAIGGGGALAAGLLLARYTHYKRSDALRFSVNATVGGTRGFLAGRTQAGVGVGVASGLVYSVADNFLRGGDRQAEPGETLVATALGDAAGWGIARMRGQSDADREMLYGGLAGFLLGSQLSPYTKFDSDGLFWIGSLGVVSSSSGALVADSATRDGTAAAMGSLTLGGAIAASQFYTPSRRDTVEASLWGGVGLGVGASLGDTRAMGLGLAAGYIGGSVAAPFTAYTNRDRTLIVSTAAAGAGLGAVAPALDRAVPGASARTRGATVGAAAGLVAGATAAQWLEVRPGRILELAGTAGLAAAIADGAVALSPLESGSPQERTRARMGAGAVILGGRLALEPFLDIAEWHTPVAFTAVGTSLGAWAPSALGRGDARHGVQLGVGLGLIGGAFASGRLAGDGADRFELVLASAAGQAVGYGLGDTEQQRATAALFGGAAATTLSVFAVPYSEYSATDVAYVGGSSVFGAGYGYRMVEDSTAGAALGAGAGLLLSAGLSQTFELSPSDMAEVVFVSGLAQVLGHETAWALGASAKSRAWSSVAAGASGWIVWPYLAGATDFSGSEVAFVAAAGGFGGWSGYALSTGRASDGRARFAGLGASAGFLAGGLLSQALALDAVAVRGASIGATLGASAGFAAGQLRRGPNRGQAAALASIGVGASGAVLGGTVGRRLRVDADEVSAVLSLAAMGAWHGAWLSQLSTREFSLEGDGGRAALGGAVAGAVVAGVGATALATGATLNSADFREVTAGWAAFSGLGAGLGLALGNDDRAAALGVQAGGLVGAGLAAWLSPSLKFGDGEVSYLALTGGAGAIYGGWAASLTESSRTSAALVGASGGVLVGAALGQLYVLESDAVLETAAATAIAHGLGHEVAWMLGADRAEQSLASLAAGGLVLLAYPRLAVDTEFSGADLAFSATAAGLGAVAGYQLSAAVLDLDNEGRGRATALGASVGLVGGLAMAMPVDFDASTVRGTAWGASIGTGVGFALGQLALPRDRAEVVAYSTVGLGLGGALFGGTVGQSLALDGADAGLVAALGGLGAWHGAWSSQLFKAEVDFASPGRRRAAAGGAAAGLVVGTLAGAWLAADQDYSTWDLTEASLGWSASAAFGAGLGLTVSDDDRWAVGLMHGTGLVGGLALARLAPETDFSGDDMLLGSLTMGHFVWQGIGIGRLLELEPREFAGTMMMMTAGGGLLGAAVGNRLNLSTAETWAAFSGEVWGSWLGAWVGYLYADEWRPSDRHPGTRRTRDVVAGVSAVTSNVGLLASALSIGAWDEMTPRRMGWINLFGAAGALSGAAAGALVPTRNNVSKGNVIGTVVGLGTGVVVTGITGWGQRPASTVAAAEKPRRRVLIPEFEQVMPAFSAVPQTDPDWMPENAEGFYLGVSGRWK